MWNSKKKTFWVTEHQACGGRKAECEKRKMWLAKEGKRKTEGARCWTKQRITMASFPESGHVATANLPHAGRHVHATTCVCTRAHARTYTQKCFELPCHRSVDGSGAAFVVTFKKLESHDESCLLHLTKANARVTFHASWCQNWGYKWSINSLIVSWLTSWWIID